MNYFKINNMEWGKKQLNKMPTKDDNKLELERCLYNLKFKLKLCTSIRINKKKNKINTWRVDKTN